MEERILQLEEKVQKLETDNKRLWEILLNINKHLFSQPESDPEPPFSNADFFGKEE